MGALMEQPVLVMLRQWIGGTKNIVDNIVLVGARDGCAQAENQSENYPLHNKGIYCISFEAGISGGGRVNCLPFSSFGQSGQSSWSSSGPNCILSAVFCRLR